MRVMPAGKMNLYFLIADFVLVLHFALVAFNVLGFVVIWIGCFRAWSFVRNFYFRLAHLLAMTIVAAQAVAGVDCPLTVWEYDLRELGGAEVDHGQGFVAYWLHRILFFNFPAAAFTFVYVLFFLLIV